MTKFFQRLLHLLFLILRPLTLGVRAICYDSNTNCVLLVKHTYSQGWFLPGGGVEVGETVEACLHRELKEEVGICPERTRLLGIFHNSSISKRDHVFIYLVNSWQEHKTNPRHRLEIAGASWFSVDQLPDDLAPCTRHALLQYGID